MSKIGQNTEGALTLWIYRVIIDTMMRSEKGQLRPARIERIASIPSNAVFYECDKKVIEYFKKYHIFDVEDIKGIQYERMDSHEIVDIVMDDYVENVRRLSV